ncbi:MAG: hypothetical protein IPL96_06970 [Holophagaceae bacterium]|nr:hypothetical protein [Holophagaceae bacterium]
MKLTAFGPKEASILWIEPHRIHGGGQSRALQGPPDEDQLAVALNSLAPGPTFWIVDDLWAPSVLLRDIVELPPGAEAQEAFFRWRYAQHLALDGAHAVQSIKVGEATYLVAGLPQELRDGWLALGARLGRTVHRLVPRWLWLYNRLAPTRELPGMLLSLCPVGGGKYTGTLAAWGRDLALLRQWSDPADAETWVSDRVMTSSAFLARENRSPQELWVWGAPTWPTGALPHHLLQPEIPGSEAL